LLKSFSIIGKPFGKQRARTLKSGHSYNPPETVHYENLVKLSYQQQVDDKTMFPGALEVSITAFFPIPESYSNKKKEACRTNQIRPTTKPDCDNIAKIVCDALNKIAYNDDSQIVEIKIRKFYSDVPQVDVFMQDVN